VSEIKFVYFDEQDVIRHNLVGRIVKAYERYESREEEDGKKGR